MTKFLMAAFCLAMLLAGCAGMANNSNNGPNPGDSSAPLGKNEGSYR
jgi:PBP1b-binding outer membrane lipoprotein LpoB